MSIGTRAIGTAAIGIGRKASAGGGDATANFAPVETDDTSALPVTLTVTATVPAVEADDAASIVGQVGDVITLTLAPTEADDTPALSLLIGNGIVLAPAEEDDTSALPVTAGFGLTFAAAEESDYSALPTSLVALLTVEASEGNDTSSFAAFVSGIVAPTTTVIVLVEDIDVNPVPNVRVVATSADPGVFTVAPWFQKTDANGQAEFTLTGVASGSAVDLDFEMASDPAVNATVDVTVTM